MKTIQNTDGKCNHSKKDCICGGHNSKNKKKNKQSNGTRLKLLIKKTRKALNKIQSKSKQLTIIKLPKS